VAGSTVTILHGSWTGPRSSRIPVAARLLPRRRPPHLRDLRTINNGWSSLMPALDRYGMDRARTAHGLPSHSPCRLQGRRWHLGAAAVGYSMSRDLMFQTTRRPWELFPELGGMLAAQPGDPASSRPRPQEAPMRAPHEIWNAAAEALHHARESVPEPCSTNGRSYRPTGNRWCRMRPLLSRTADRIEANHSVIVLTPGVVR
jgi:hypothetical protein